MSHLAEKRASVCRWIALGLSAGVVFVEEKLAGVTPYPVSKWIDQDRECQLHCANTVDKLYTLFARDLLGPEKVAYTLTRAYFSMVSEALRGEMVFIAPDILMDYFHQRCLELAPVNSFSAATKEALS
jgi:hypothetical protein